jgi:hypothetical protein
MDKGSKEYWGPRVWRLLHLLANISDRRDVPSVWRQLLRQTALILPCEKCRVHFTAYMKEHSIVGNTNPIKLTGALVRDTLKENLCVFHNAVNARLGKPIIGKETYDELYPPKLRKDILLEVQGLLDELKAAWTPLIHRSITQGNFTIWKNTLVLLIALLSGGPS